jgi:hypothetical protein
MYSHHSFVCFLILLALIAFISSQIITEIGLNGVSGPFATSCGTYSYYKLNFPYPCKDLNVTVNPTQGEPDVFISKTVMYPGSKDLTWAVSADYQYSIAISHWDASSSPGYYYISVYDDCAKQNKIAVYTISAHVYEDPSSSNDIYLYPSAGLNQNTTAEAYRFLRFCIPECSDVRVTLENCLDNNVCPGAYSYPELLLSRTDVHPTINDYR